jgi:DNA-directed RNA polymerase specialized sigma24 family protein
VRPDDERFYSLSSEEIAEILQLERSTVTPCPRQARMALKAILEPYAAAEG